MPIYTWICDECDNVVEKLIASFYKAEQTRVVCKECGTVMKRKTVSETAWTPEKWKVEG